MDDTEKLTNARRHVAAVKGFYIHLSVFILVNILLVAINWAIGTPWWAQWPFLGWGVGIIGHALAVFGQLPGFAKDWEARQVKRYMDRTPN